MLEKRLMNKVTPRTKILALQVSEYNITQYYKKKSILHLVNIELLSKMFEKRLMNAI